jgi:uncharacterized protein
MPTVISDASVLIDLGAVGLIGLLREFYIEVFVPPAVWREVTSAGSRPGSAEVQLAKNDGWLHIKVPTSSAFVMQLKRQLDDGEAEAIALAVEFPQSLVLIDESDGRETASLLGLDFTGTIGVLLRARKSGRLPALKPVLDTLIQQHSFRLARPLYDQVLREAGESP